MARPSKTPQPRRNTPPGTLGYALRARRWELGLEQAAAAKQIGVSKSTYQTWEWNAYVPGVRQVPTVIAFLRYDWREAGTSFGAKLQRARTAAGLTIEELAAEIGVDETTVWRWENDEVAPSQSLLPRIHAWLGSR